MDRSFFFWVKRYDTVSHKRFFGPDSDFYRDRINNGHKIYFILKTPRSHFEIITFKAIHPYTIAGQISVDGRHYTARIDLAQVYYSIQKLSERFTSKQAMAEFIMRATYGDPALTKISLEQQFINNTEVDLVASSDQLLKVRDALTFAMTQDSKLRFETSVYQAINYLNLASPPMEVVYIGKSYEAGERLYNHEKWGRITGNTEATEDLIIYVLDIESEIRSYRDPDDVVSRFSRSPHDINIEDATSLAEMSLIRYFVPRHNRKYTESDLTGTDPVKYVLLPKNYTRMGGTWGVTGSLGHSVGTESRQYVDQHEFFHGLKPWVPADRNRSQIAHFIPDADV